MEDKYQYEDLYKDLRKRRKDYYLYKEEGLSEKEVNGAEEDEMEGEAEEEDAGDEEAKVKRMTKRDPNMPTKGEAEKHARTHLPFRS